MWEEAMLLLLTVASQSPEHWEACMTVVSDAVHSMSSELLRGNSNERTRVESTQTTIRARCVLCLGLYSLMVVYILSEWQFSVLK